MRVRAMRYDGTMTEAARMSYTEWADLLRAKRRAQELNRRVMAQVSPPKFDEYGIAGTMRVERGTR